MKKKLLYMEHDIGTQLKIESILDKKIEKITKRVKSDNISKILMTILNDKNMKGDEKIEIIFYLGRYFGRLDTEPDTEVDFRHYG